MAASSATRAAGSHDALARVVHDLHGPLTVIRGLCATLAREEPRPERRRALDLIDAEAVRLAEGLRGIARMGRTAGGGPRSCDLAGVVAATAERFAAAAAARRVVLRVRTERPSVRGAAAPGDVERIIDNLVRNAIRHAAEGGAVTLGLAIRGGRAEVRVRDDGAGVPAGDRERIFRAGNRGSAPTGAGRGLGLAIARDLAEANGGALSLDAVGSGACFRLALPLAPAGDEDPRAA